MGCEWTMFFENMDAKVFEKYLNPVILCNLGHFLIITIFMGLWWPIIYENAD